MPPRMLVELQNGNKILFGGDGRGGGLSEASLGGDIATASAEKFKSALGSLSGLVDILQDQVSRIAQRPETIEMEFRASLTGECNLWVVSGDAEAEFKVTLRWGKD